MSWLLIKELVGASQQKPNQSAARPARLAPSDSSSSSRELRRGPQTMGGPCGWFRSWRWVLSANLGPLCPGCGTLDLFLPCAQLQCPGYQNSICSQIMNSFALVGGICSPHGKSIFKDLFGTGGGQ